MLNCKDITKMVSARYEEKLTFFSSVRFYIHLAICKSCRRFSKHQELIHRACSELRKSEDFKSD